VKYLILISYAVIGLFFGAWLDAMDRAYVTPEHQINFAGYLVLGLSWPASIPFALSVLPGENRWTAGIKRGEKK